MYSAIKEFQQLISKKEILMDEKNLDILFHKFVCYLILDENFNMIDNKKCDRLQEKKVYFVK